MPVFVLMVVEILVVEWWLVAFFVVVAFLAFLVVRVILEIAVL